MTSSDYIFKHSSKKNIPGTRTWRSAARTESLHSYCCKTTTLTCRCPRQGASGRWKCCLTTRTPRTKCPRKCPPEKNRFRRWYRERSRRSPRSTWSRWWGWWTCRAPSRWRWRWRPETDTGRRCLWKLKFSREVSILYKKNDPCSKIYMVKQTQKHGFQTKHTYRRRPPHTAGTDYWRWSCPRRSNSTEASSPAYHPQTSQQGNHLG